MSARLEMIIPEVDAFELEAARVVTCARDGEEPITAGRKMRDPAALALAAYESVRMSREVEFPLE